MLDDIRAAAVCAHGAGEHRRFAYALKCMATVGAIRRETGTWKWPLVAFGCLTGLAWVLAFLAHELTALVLS